MYEGKRYLCIIPARCGSKRIPHKNIKPVASKPLIAWSIEAAKKSAYIDKTIVSTDCEEVAEVAKGFGAEIPFIRPKEIAGDTHNVVDAVIHAVDYLAAQGESYEYVIILQPTSPLRTAGDIDNAIRFLESKKADAVVSVCESDISPRWIKQLPEDMAMEVFSADTSTRTRSQDLGRHYRLNGSIYIVDIPRVREEKNIYLNENIYAFVMDRHHSVDIDEPEDLVIADALLRARREGEKTHNVTHRYRDGYALAYPESHMIRIYEYFVKNRLPGSERCVFEFGFGSGAHLAFFNDKGLDVYGCDSDPKNVAAAAERYGRPDRFRHLPEIDTLEELFEKQTFDLVVCNQSLSFYDNGEIGKIIAGLFSLCRPGGTVILTVLSRENYYMGFATGEERNGLKKCEVRTERTEHTEWINFIRDEAALAELAGLFAPIQTGSYDFSYDGRSSKQLFFVGTKEQ